MTDLVGRYRDNYGIPAEAPITEAEVRAHYELELALTRELLESTPENRWETFDRCYSRLYSELTWLDSRPARASLQPWSSLIGAPPRRIYEVGSGEARLAVALADAGYQVVATEITRERGGERVEAAGLQWAQTDGVHLDRFADPESFDAVISDQVVEHLHPDDLVEHLWGARALLRPGGRYVVRTPHAAGGPADISRVFGLDEPVGMHLREYTYRELATAAQTAGFRRSTAALGLPARLGMPVRSSRLYLRYLIFAERQLGGCGRAPGAEP